MDAEAIVEIWSTIKPFVPQKDRVDAAEAFATVIDEYGWLDELSELFLDKELELAIKSRIYVEEYEDDDDDQY